MSHNKRLDAMLAKVRETAESAREERDFDPIFATLRQFRDSVGPIRYDNRVKWYICAVTALLGGGFALAFFLNPALQQSLDVVGYGVIAAFAIATFVTLLVIAFANSGISSVSELIFRKDVFFDNHLQEQDIGNTGNDLYETLKEEFGEFCRRGDEGRYIDRLYRGTWTGSEFSFPYEYYVFHYVRVYYVPVTKKVGNTTVTTIERRTETLYRYGLILDFPFAKGIVMRSGGGSYDYPRGYQPTSEDFSRQFDVGADDEHVAAKFLKPAVVLAFLDMTKSLSGMNVEISRQGRMNVAFSDSDILERRRTSSIADPDAFEAEIRDDLALPKLRKAMAFVETLKKHNDSNF